MAKPSYLSAGKKRIVRIAVGGERALSKASAFTMAVTEEERAFLDLLVKKIERFATNEVQFLMVMDFEPEGESA